MKPSINPYQPHLQAQKRGFIKGYASCFETIDQQRDIISKGAFAKTLHAWRLSGKKIKMLWQHNPHELIGCWTHLQTDAHGLYVEGRLALGIERANEAYLLLKEGILDGLSIGFRTIKAVHDQQRKARLILDIDLIEISLVTFGANARATVSGVKFRNA